MNAKRKRTRNEHRSIELLESRGYGCTRAAATLGAWDIIAAGPADVVLVSVKTNACPRRAEIERLDAFTVPPTCRKLVHQWRDRQRRPDIRGVIA